MLKDKRYADIRTNYNSGLAELLSAIRSHAATGKPVSAGARIESGRITYERMTPDFPLYRGLINTIEAGCFERFETGLKVHVQIVSSHQTIQEWAEALGLTKMTLESSDYSISTNPATPTRFLYQSNIHIRAGTSIPDVMTGGRISLPFDLTGKVETQVSGTANGGVIEGRFNQITILDPPCPIPRADIIGSFKAIVAL